MQSKGQAICLQRLTAMHAPAGQPSSPRGRTRSVWQLEFANSSPKKVGIKIWSPTTWASFTYQLGNETSKRPIESHNWQHPLTRTCNHCKSILQSSLVCRSDLAVCRSFTHDVGARKGPRHYSRPRNETRTSYVLSCVIAS